MSLDYLSPCCPYTKSKFPEVALFDIFDCMDLELAQKSKLVELVKESFLTIRSFQMLRKEDLTGIGFPHPAIIEIKNLIRQRGDTPRTPVVNAETPSPLHIETPSTASNKNSVLSMLTASELKRLTETLVLKSAASLREFNRVLVAEMVKVAVVLFFFIDILNLKVINWIEKKT